MRDFIYKLRQRPVHHRKHILNISTLVAIFVLGSLWIYSLGNTISNVELDNKMTEKVNPAGALRANIVDGYKSIRDEQIPEPKASELRLDVLE